MGVLRPDLIIKSVVPVVMAGILGIYGLIISVIINQKSILLSICARSWGSRRWRIPPKEWLLSSGLWTLQWPQLSRNFTFYPQGAGLAIGIVGDAGVRANAQQDQVFVGMLLVLIFAEALGLYGLIVAIIISQ